MNDLLARLSEYRGEIITWQEALDRHPHRSGVRLQLAIAGAGRTLCPGRCEGKVRRRLRRGLDQGDERGPLRSGLTRPLVKPHAAGSFEGRPFSLARWVAMRDWPTPKAEPAEPSEKNRKPLDFVGERAGARTLDLLIKSQLLYQLSYALPTRETAPGCRRGQRVHTQSRRSGQPGFPQPNANDIVPRRITQLACDCERRSVLTATKSRP